MQGSTDDRLRPAGQPADRPTEFMNAVGTWPDLTAAAVQLLRSGAKSCCPIRSEAYHSVSSGLPKATLEHQANEFFIAGAVGRMYKASSVGL